LLWPFQRETWLKNSKTSRNNIQSSFWDSWPDKVQKHGLLNAMLARRHQGTPCDPTAALAGTIAAETVLTT
jgi:hypothetical protein